MPFPDLKEFLAEEFGQVGYCSENDEGETYSRLACASWDEWSGSIYYDNPLDEKDERKKNTAYKGFRYQHDPEYRARVRLNDDISKRRRKAEAVVGKGNAMWYDEESDCDVRDLVRSFEAILGVSC